MKPTDHKIEVYRAGRHHVFSIAVKKDAAERVRMLFIKENKLVRMDYRHPCTVRPCYITSASSGKWTVRGLVLLVADG